VSAKRLANVKADLASALVLSGAVPELELAPKPNDEWQSFLDGAEPWYRASFLKRFANYCTHIGVNPSGVDQSVLERFRAHVDERLLISRPAKVVRDTVVAFNAMAKKDCRPYSHLRVSNATRYVAAPLGEYPPSFQDDLKRYITRLTKPDPFDPTALVRPLRPSTIRNTEASIRQLLDAAVSGGVPRHQFRSLADLINVNVVRTAVDVIKARHAGNTPTTLGAILATLIAIGRHYVKAPPETVALLKRAQMALSVHGRHRSITMSRKSQHRLTQFEDLENIARLVELPHLLMRRAEKARGTKHAAIDALVASAIAVLLAVPLRAQNLATLRVGQELVPQRDGKKARYLLHIAPEKTKNLVAIDAVIEAPMATIINDYVLVHRQHLGKDLGDWVFPRVSGGHRSPSTISSLVKERIHREIGLVMHLHLFRHFAAAVYLEHHPGAFEDVRRLMSHRKIETTTSFYAPASTRSARRRYDEILKGYRGEGL